MCKNLLIPLLIAILAMACSNAGKKDNASISVADFGLMPDGKTALIYTQLGRSSCRERV